MEWLKIDFACKDVLKVTKINKEISLMKIHIDESSPQMVLLTQAPNDGMHGPCWNDRVLDLDTKFLKIPSPCQA